MARNITGFEAAPQGQIGSGFAQVFDTTPVLQAAVQQQERRRQEFAELMDELALIDPNLARPVDTPVIMEAYKGLNEFVVDNYEAIQNPMDNPEMALEFKRRKNEILKGIQLSQAVGKHTLELSENMFENDYYVAAYDKNKSKVRGWANKGAVSFNNGKLETDRQAYEFLSETLEIGKDPNEFTSELAKDMKPQYTDGNFSSIMVGGEKILLRTPDQITRQDVDAIIETALSGNTANSVGVINSLVGIESPYDQLPDVVKAQVRDTIRPLLLQKLDTEPDWKGVSKGQTINIGNKAKDPDYQQRGRVIADNVSGISYSGVDNTDIGGEFGLLTSQSNEVRGGEVIKVLNFEKGGKTTTREFVIGEMTNDGAVIAQDKRSEEELEALIEIYNTALNKRAGGEVTAPDMEYLKQIIQTELSGRNVMQLSTGDTYQVDGEQYDKAGLESYIATTVASGDNPIGNIQTFLSNNGFESGSYTIQRTQDGNMSIVGSKGDNIATFDLSTTDGKMRFAQQIIDKFVMPNARPTGFESVNFSSAWGGQSQPQTNQIDNTGNPFATQ